MSATLEAAGVDVSELQRHPTATIHPDAAIRSLPPPAALARLRGATLMIHHPLGEGGMGIVLSATQLRLGREVAVKTLRQDVVTDRAVTELVREAWVTGSLEHPNIIPVHDIELDERGVPQIVLKRVEGDDWSALLREPDAIRLRFGVDDVLEQNIRILMQVSNAVSFAHSRGILHRDIKPANVMVGSFGEVYVADWGLAVAMEDDGTGRIPSTSSVHRMAGTPAYMAPEQAFGQSELGPWTDVFLLGATLYEIVVGRAPHRGETLAELMAAIAASEPEIPEDIPSELADILRRAMHRTPRERFASAEELRLALGAFLEHRGAARLAASAKASLATLSGLLEREVHGASVDDGDVQRVFSQCRFACQQALEAWAGASDAEATLSEATLSMAERELRRGEPSSAQALLATLAVVPGELRARVQEALVAREAEVDRLRGVDRTHDPATGRRIRFWLAGLIGVSWTASPLLIEVGRSMGREVTHSAAITWDSFGIAALLVGGVIFRDRLLQSVVNRRLELAALTAFAMQLTLHVGDTLRGVDALTTTVNQFPVWAAIATGLALGVDGFFLLPAAIFALSYVLLCHVPQLVFPTMSACNLVVLLVIIRVSRRPASSP
ncbi:MAG: serine/threonine protein kinase [Deltaproteobacteria bacterium]|nr:serine/threonine protein kinase [Deltaproteobacteria bacterium]